MTGMKSWSKLGELAERESLQPDLGRGFRAALAFMVPLLLAIGGWLPVAAISFAAIAGQNIAMVDVRGAYRLRLGLLLAMSAIFGGAAALGTLASANLTAAVLATVFIALCGGLWRHLSSDYGMALAISSTLVFFIALASPLGPAAAREHALAAFLGALWGLALQVANWPFRPQQPLRRTVAETWIAAADLFEAMAPGEPADVPRRLHRINECEAALRTTLDQTYSVLAAARPGELRTRLEALNLTGARLATRIVVLNTALEPLMASAAAAGFQPALQPALTSLTNTARTVALAVTSRRPAHFATLELRLRRLANLLRLLRTRASLGISDPAAGSQVAEILRQIEQMIPEIEGAVRATVDPTGERTAFSLELFDLDTWTLRPLAATLNLTRRVDPALIRFTLRLAVLTAVGVVIFKVWELPHGYWLPFTIVVVLQPDYGSTRQRAAQRVAGTLAGSAVASLLLWQQLPFTMLATAMAVTVFAFGYFLKRNYAIAVFFVTLFIVLLTGATEPISASFTLERLLTTFAGGALALAAALFFWPVWERDRFPPVLASGLRANADFLRQLMRQLRQGSGYDSETLAAKRRSETANSTVFSALQRMTGDPRNRREGLEYFATLANGNQRLTRALTVLILHLNADAPPLAAPDLLQFEKTATQALEEIAGAVERGTTDLLLLRERLRELEGVPLSPTANAGSTDTDPRNRWVFSQLTRAATELSAMLLTMLEERPETAHA